MPVLSVMFRLHGGSDPYARRHQGDVDGSPASCTVSSFWRSRRGPCSIEALNHGTAGNYCDSSLCGGLVRLPGVSACATTSKETAADGLSVYSRAPGCR